MKKLKDLDSNNIDLSAATHCMISGKLKSLSLNFLIHKTEILKMPNTSQDCHKNYIRKSL